MKILIVDDEKLARIRLDNLIKKIGDHTVVGEAANGREAIDLTNTTKPDILLMDIRMPVMDGIEAALHLSALEAPPIVIFTSAYDQHALEAFEANAIDYLLKPIRQDRLQKALDKAEQMSLKEMVVRGKLGDEVTPRTHISVHDRGQITLIPLQDVCYFSADNKYVAVRTAKEKYLIEDSLTNLEEEFKEQFRRIHRSTLVSIDYIDGLEKLDSGHWCVVMKNIPEKLGVSRRHTSSLRHWVNS